MKWGPRVEEAAAILDAPGLEVSSAAIKIGIVAATEVDQLYGPASANPLDHHNAPHTIDTAGRTMYLLNLLHPFIDMEKWGPDLPDVCFTEAMGHDLRQLLRGVGANERAAGRRMLQLIDEHSSGRKRPPWKPRLEVFKTRVNGGIMSTVTELIKDEGDDLGEIVQTRLTYGIHDPAKFILAFADINPIAVEGPERMVRDGLNLYVERCRLLGETVTVHGAVRFLGTQPRFIRDHLYENRVQSHIAYFWPGENMLKVYEVLETEFKDNIKEAADLARIIKENPKSLEMFAGGILSKAGVILPG